jgi:hypothetical protein
VKPFIAHDIDQRSPEWRQLRLGKLTGSCGADMLATIKSGEAASRRNLRIRLAIERITGISQESDFTSRDMERGTELEPEALAAYEALTGDLAQSIGFVELPTIKAGCSPDGYLGDYDVIVSLKCPKSATHYGYLCGHGVPSDYVPQMLHELWITGAQAYDFLSYDPRFPINLRTFYVRVERASLAAQIDEYAEKAVAFLAEVDRAVETLQTMDNLRGQLTRSVAVA